MPRKCMHKYIITHKLPHVLHQALPNPARLNTFWKQTSQNISVQGACMMFKVIYNFKTILPLSVFQKKCSVHTNIKIP